MLDALSMIRATVEPGVSNPAEAFLNACDTLSRQGVMDYWPGMLDAFRARITEDPRYANIMVGPDCGTSLEYDCGKVFWVLNSEHPRIQSVIQPSRLPSLVKALVAMGHAYKDHGKNRRVHPAMTRAFRALQAFDSRLELGWNPNYAGTGRHRLFASH